MKVLNKNCRSHAFCISEKSLSSHPRLYIRCIKSNFNHVWLSFLPLCITFESLMQTHVIGKKGFRTWKTEQRERRKKSFALWMLLRTIIKIMPRRALATRNDRRSFDFCNGASFFAGALHCFSLHIYINVYFFCMNVCVPTIFCHYAREGKWPSIPRKQATATTKCLDISNIMWDEKKRANIPEPLHEQKLL